MVGSSFFRFFLWPRQPFGLEEEPYGNCYCKKANDNRNYSQGIDHEWWTWWLGITQKSTFISYPQCRKA